VLQENDFDAWGRKRNPTDWTFNSVPAANLFTRGYTGHEHLDIFGLINMPARRYAETSRKATGDQKKFNAK
jgi:hypothetical protein